MFLWDSFEDFHFFEILFIDSILIVNRVSNRNLQNSIQITVVCHTLVERQVYEMFY